MAIIYLTRFPECPAPRCRVRLLPEGFFPLSREKRAGNSSLCFVLHHMGFFVRLRLRENPVGSYPAFSPLPSTRSCQFSVVGCQLNQTWPSVRKDDLTPSKTLTLVSA